MNRNPLTKRDLIKGINWEVPFYQLTTNQKADFLHLTGHRFLNEWNRDTVISQYNYYRRIFEERGIENMEVYF